MCMRRAVRRRRAGHSPATPVTGARAAAECKWAVLGGDEPIGGAGEAALRLEARRESHLELIGPQAVIEAEARAEAWAEAEMIAAAAEAREAALQAHGRAGLRTREELARGGE